MVLMELYSVVSLLVCIALLNGRCCWGLQLLKPVQLTLPMVHPSYLKSQSQTVETKHLRTKRVYDSFEVKSQEEKASTPTTSIPFLPQRQLPLRSVTSLDSMCPSHTTNGTTQSTMVVDLSNSAYSTIRAVATYINDTTPKLSYFCLDLQNNSLTQILTNAFASSTFKLMITLNLNFNFITFIEVGAFGDPANSCTALTSVSLHANMLTSLPPNFLSGRGIGILDLSSNRFATAPQSVLNGTQLPKLNILSLGDNMLTYIDLTPLDGVMFCTVLLSNNEITQISYTPSKFMYSISHLEAASNQLQHIPPSFGCIMQLMLNDNPGISDLVDLYCPSATAGGPTLNPIHTENASSECGTPTSSMGLITSSLSLSGCSISIISNTTFRIPSALPSFQMSSLDLSNNLLEVIENGAFGCLTQINNLFLSGNRLTNLNSAMFGAVAIHYLDVSFNRITQVQRSSLPALSSIQGLTLEGNLISTVSTLTFGDPQSSLASINMAKNHLTSVPPLVFANCSMLSSLNIADNNLTLLTPSYFETLTALTTLNLARNNIAIILNGTFRYQSQQLFASVDLSGNALTAVTKNITSSLGTVQTIMLADNDITAIEAGSLDTLPGVLTLNLRANQLSIIRGQVRYRCDP